MIEINRKNIDIMKNQKQIIIEETIMKRTEVKVDNYIKRRSIIMTQERTTKDTEEIINKI